MTRCFLDKTSDYHGCWYFPPRFFLSNHGCFQTIAEVPAYHLSRFVYKANLLSMRIWLLLLMVSLGLRPALRSTTLRAALKTLYSWGHLKLHNLQPIPISIQATAMSNLASVVAASAPPDRTECEPSASTTSNTQPSEPELPKLSAADFRIYNRLAVMMDAYVSLRLALTDPC